jgi:4-amino-4-deoxy-L-arabinose transferase-like glycosyltransferase
VASTAWGWAFVAVGIGLRAAWVFAVDPELIKDSSWYFSHAVDFADGRGYQEAGLPTAYWPVGYPALLGGLFRLLGPDLMAARLLNVALAAATLACIRVVGRRVTGSPLAANLAVLLFAVYPTDIAYSSLVVTEPLFNALMMAGVACFLAIRQPVARPAAAGLCFGLAALTRAHGLLLPALVGIGALLLAGGSWKRSAALIAATYLALTAAIAPWCIRNLIALDAFVPVSTNGGLNLHIGNNPHATGSYRYDELVKEPLRAARIERWRGGAGEVELDRFASALARRYILENPGDTIALWPAKLVALFGGEGSAAAWNRWVPPSQVGRVRAIEHAGRRVYPALWLLALLGLAASVLGRRVSHLRLRAPLLAGAVAIGLPGLGWWAVPVAALLGWLAVRDGPPPRLLLPWLAPAVIVGFTLVQVVYFGEGRYHHVMMPWVAILAGSFAALAVGRGGRLAEPSPASRVAPARPLSTAA